MKSILQKIKMEDEANQDASLFNVISNKHSKNMTRFFWSDCLERIYGSKMNNFICIFIWGEQGTAKSGVGQLIAQTLFPDFSIDYIAMSNEHIRKIMKDLPPRRLLLRDEFQKAFGDGTYQLQATIDNYARQLRDRENSFIYIQPDYTNMTNFHYYLRAIFFDIDKKMVRCGIQNPMTNGYMGYVDFNLAPIWENGLWKEYQEVKNKFVNQVALNTYDKLDLREISLEMMEIDEFRECITKTKKDYKIIKGALKNFVYKNSPNLTISQNNMLVEEIKLIFNSNPDKWINNNDDDSEIDYNDDSLFIGGENENGEEKK